MSRAVFRQRLTRSCQPVSPALRKPNRLALPSKTPYTQKVLINLNQGYEDAIESMKLQFAAITEQKAEVERKHGLLTAEYDKLKKQMDDFANREEEQRASSSRGLLYHRTFIFPTGSYKWSGRGTLEGVQRYRTFPEEACG